MANPILREDVDAAVAATLNVALPMAADQAIIANETWSNRADSFDKAFKKALEDLGRFDAATVGQLVKSFKAELPDAQRKREKAAEEATKTTAKANEEAADKAAKEAAFIKDCIAETDDIRKSVSQLARKSANSVKELTDSGMAAPSGVKSQLTKLTKAAKESKEAWENARKAATKTDAEAASTKATNAQTDAEAAAEAVQDWIDAQASIQKLSEEAETISEEMDELLQVSHEDAEDARKAATKALRIKTRGLDAERQAVVDARKAMDRAVKSLEDAGDSTTEALEELEEAVADGKKPEAIAALKSARASLKQAKKLRIARKIEAVKTASRELTEAAEGNKVDMLDLILSDWRWRWGILIASLVLALGFIPPPWKYLLGIGWLAPAALAIFTPVATSRVGKVVITGFVLAVVILVGYMFMVHIMTLAPSGGKISAPPLFPTKTPWPTPTPYPD